MRVAAIVPGRESYNTQVNLNDWIMCVNDLEVRWDNLDSILSAVTSPKQVSRCCEVTIISISSVLNNTTNTKLKNELIKT